MNLIGRGEVWEFLLFPLDGDVVMLLSWRIRLLLGGWGRVLKVGETWN